ncbi:WD40/YVTN/BNR-like repeat-containing protein [Anaerobacillus sp. MEB173]|uniref:WD40/YVTN/BNR-like repeat-containing protein n=1 Tax=Anaerobacillus sp. MEB173 TaxID=3383345 RepID=UPI003F8EC873
MRISECLLGATAVTRGNNGDYFLAVNKGIILIKKDGSKQQIIQLDTRILDLKCSGDILYGVGDEGTFIRSLDYGKSWTTQKMKTLGPIWSVCCNEDGTVVTHGNHILFLSHDFGQTWKTVHPFHSLKYKPSIRSILLDNSFVYIGTKIHQKYGGIWKLNLLSFHMVRIKHDKRMISSMIKHKQYIITAIGTSKGCNGSIEFCRDNARLNQYKWERCESDTEENCYLDLSESSGFLYTTTTQDGTGVGKVLRIFLDEKKVTHCAYVHGHGWRVSNNKNEFLVAGLYGSLYANAEVNNFIH